jgi:2'-5' RNA ligase
MSRTQAERRLFIGIVPDKITRDFLRDSIRILNRYSRNLRSVSVDQLHMTLQFLGNNVTDASLEAITDQLQRKLQRQNSIMIKLDELNFGFKGQSSPSVLFWTVEQSPELKQLTNEIHTLVQELKLEDVKRQKDQSRLIHHITVARTKRTFSRREVRSLMQKFQSEFRLQPAAFKAESFSIIESLINKNGNVYKTLETFPL